MELNSEGKIEPCVKSVLSRSNIDPYRPTIALLLLILLISVENSTASDNQLEITAARNHLSWTRNKTRFDFVFRTDGAIQNVLKLETDSNNYLTNSLAGCQNNSACLFRNGSLVDYFRLKTPEQLTYSGQRSVYISVKDLQVKPDQQLGECDQNEFTILHYCSTHWNPPSYMYRSKCSHTIEWHSPLTCHTNSTNYERPCYIYDPQGRLIDLTPLIKSDNSCYKVDTSPITTHKNETQSKLQPNNWHPSQIKGFFMNVCNEAFDMCGPNVSACFMDPERGGLVEAGYNNLTSIKFDAKASNTVILTMQGHFKQQCENSRIKTVMRFVCKKRGIPKPEANGEGINPTYSKLLRADGCTNVLEWKSIHACPMTETQAPMLPDCKLRYEPAGIDIDVSQMIKNTTLVEVPNIHGLNKKMVLGICKPVPTSYNCEGKKTSSTSACLIDTSNNDGGMESGNTAKNSKIVATITKSTLRLADDRLYMESSAVNRTCSTPVGDARSGFNVTKQIGVRIEFYCSAKEQREPTYLGFDDCTYTFEWASPLMCFEETPSLVKNGSDNKATTVETLSPRPPTSDDVAKKVADELHKATMKEASEINGAIESHQEHHHKEQPRPADVATTTELIERKSGVDTGRLAANSSGAAIQEPQLAKPKMNLLHKFLMISLIIMSLVAFLVIILVLDKKTRLRIPLGSIRRQARQSFQAQSVPYSRVANDLDL